MSCQFRYGMLTRRGTAKQVQWQLKGAAAAGAVAQRPLLLARVSAVHRVFGKQILWLGHGLHGKQQLTLPVIHETCSTCRHAANARRQPALCERAGQLQPARAPAHQLYASQAGGRPLRTLNSRALPEGSRKNMVHWGGGVGRWGEVNVRKEGLGVVEGFRACTSAAQPTAGKGCTAGH